MDYRNNLESIPKKGKHFPYRSEVRMIDQRDELAGCRMWVADTEPGGVVRVAVPELRQLFSIPGDELETVAPTLWPPDRAFYGGGGKLTERNAHFQLTTQREVG